MTEPQMAESPPPGLYKGVPAEIYHSWAWLSNSGVTDLLQSPSHYYARHLDPNRPLVKSTPAQRLGTLFHSAILEPELFDYRHPELPFPDRRTKAAKEWLEALSPDQEAATAEERQAALMARDSVMAIPDVRDALSCGHAETSAVWRDPVTTLRCRCRPDWTHEAGAGVVLLDVKTYDDASPSAFARQIARMGYHQQDAWYSGGYALAAERPVLGFLFVAVESKYPYAAAVYQLDDDAREAGRLRCRRALDLYAKCMETRDWPGYDTAITPLSLPVWALEESL